MMAGRLQHLGHLGHLSHLAMGLGLAFGLGACFIEPPLPANFRFECASSSECQDGEVCTQGLCQQPCGGESDEECSNSNFCLNGYCSGLCQVSDDRCSQPQVCTSLVPPGEETDEEIPGVCIVPCGDDNPCPEGQLCYEDLGLCVGPCMTGFDCGQGEECLMGFCVPRFG